MSKALAFALGQVGDTRGFRAHLAGVQNAPAAAWWGSGDRQRRGQGGSCPTHLLWLRWDHRLDT